MRWSVVTLPMSATAGNSFAVSVQAQDYYGNLATSFSGEVTITDSTLSGGFAGTLTAPVVNGVATFSSLTATAAGSHSFSVSSGSNTASLQGYYGSLWVQPGSLASLSAHAPITVRAGAAFDVDVTGQDQYGNGISPWTLASAGLNLTKTSGPGQLGGNTYPQTVWTGMDYTVRFSSQTLSDAGSVSIAVGETSVSASTIAISVVPNQAPVAGPDSVSMPLGQPSVVMDLKANDSDLDGDALTVQIVSQPSFGYVWQDYMGRWVYQLYGSPNGSSGWNYPMGFSGSDSFTYRVSDGAASSAIVTASISVTNWNNSNHAPVAADDAFSVQHGQTVSFNPIANDTDQDGDSLTASIVSYPMHGSVWFDSMLGSWRYSSYSNFAGTDSFSYRVSDGFAVSNIANVVVTALNAAPVAVSDGPLMTAEGQALSNIDVKANDSDADGDTLTVNVLQWPQHGYLMQNYYTGKFDYYPSSGYVGLDSFVYTVTDGASTSQPATVSIQVGVSGPVALFAVQTPQAIEEGNSSTRNVVFTVTRSGDLSNAVSVNYQTFDGSAYSNTMLGPADYVAKSGTLTFDPGVTSLQVSVVVNGDTTIEGNETFQLQLSSPTGGIIEVASATATILNDDAQATLRIQGPGSSPEGNSGWHDFVFTVTRTGAMNSSVSVSYYTSMGSAMPAYDLQSTSGDYLNTYGTLQFAPQETTKTISVPVYGDTVVEPDETFSVYLMSPVGADLDISTATATIANDDAAPTASLTVADVSEAEGNQGWRDLTFVVAKSGSTSDTVTVRYDVTGSSASGGASESDTYADFVLQSGTLTFAPNETQKTVTIRVQGDRLNEADETFQLTLSQVANALLTRAVATATLTNDDPAPVSFQIASGSYSATEGQSAWCDLAILTLDQAASNVPFNATVNWGDGQSDVSSSSADGNVQVVQTSSTTYAIRGRHAYASDGSFGGYVYVAQPSGGNIGMMGFSATISRTQFQLGPRAQPIQGFEGENIGSVTLATITDPNVLRSATSYQVSVYWSDGASGWAQLTADPANPGSFFVRSNTTFSSQGHKWGVVSVTKGTQTETAVIEVDVGPGTPPIAQNKTITVHAGARYYSDSSTRLFPSDWPSNRSPLTLQIVSPPTNGHVDIYQDGSFAYTADRVGGSDTFTYYLDAGGAQSIVATVTISIANQAPTASRVDFSPIPDNERFVVTNRADGLLKNASDPDNDRLSFELVEAPAKGSLQFFSDGTFTYQPDPGQVGDANIRYRVTDGVAESEIVTSTLTVIPGLAIAHPDSYSVHTGRTLTVSSGPYQNNGLLGNDEGKNLKVHQLSSPAQGQLTIQQDGSFTYVAPVGFVGNATFQYKVFNGASYSDPTTVTIAVTNVAPIAQDDAYDVHSGVPFSTYASYYANNSLLANDQDGDQDNLSVHLVSGVRHGSLALHSDGTFTYTPDRAWIDSTPQGDLVGVDSFQYQAFDGTAYSETRTVTLRVHNQPPNTNVDSSDDYSVHAGKDLTTYVWTYGNSGVLRNDQDPNYDALTAALTAGPAHGSLTLAPDGTFKYVPDKSIVLDQFDSATGKAFAIDHFTYIAFDGNQTSTPTTVSIRIENQSPVASSDAYSVHAGRRLTTGWYGWSNNGVLANDADADGDTLKASLVSSPSHGVLQLSPDGTFTYDPDPGFAGVDSFVYRAFDGFAFSPPRTATIQVGNQAPQAANEQYAAASVLQWGWSNVLANDLDPDGDNLSLRLLTSPQHGRLTIASNGSFTYVPDVGFSGTDSFSYVAFDGIAASVPATATILVQGPAGAGTANPGAIAPVSRPDAYMVRPGESLSVVATSGVLANDISSDARTLTAQLVLAPAHGSVILQADGSFTYLPDASFTGSDVFSYRAADGISSGQPVAVELRSVNSIPTGTERAFFYHGMLSVSAADGLKRDAADPDGGALRPILDVPPQNGSLIFSSDGSFTYRPTAVPQSDLFTYRVTDGFAVSAPISVRLVPSNTAPKAHDDAYFVAAGMPFSAYAPSTGVLANDEDVDGDSLTARLNPSPYPGQLVVSSAPQHGLLRLNADGTFVYLPDAGFEGEDSFEYVASDGDSPSEPAHVRLVVRAGSPRAFDDAFSVQSGGSLSGDIAHVGANDLDSEGRSLRYRVTSTTSHGRLVLGSDGKFNYTPNAFFAGEDSFVYEVSNGFATSTATVRLVVTNAPPSARPDVFVTNIATDLWSNGNAFAGFASSVLGNDVDLGGGVGMRAILTESVAHGQLRFNSDGTFVYSPLRNFKGEDSFKYRVSDGISESAETTVKIDVVSKGLVAYNDAFSFALGGDQESFSIGVLGNDIYDDPNVTVTLIEGQTSGHGSLAADPDNPRQFKFTPGQPGITTFKYRISNDAESSEATGIITTLPKPPQPERRSTNVFAPQFEEIARDQIYFKPAGSLSINWPADNVLVYITDLNMPGSGRQWAGELNPLTNGWEVNNHGAVINIFLNGSYVVKPFDSGVLNLAVTVIPKNPPPLVINNVTINPPTVSWSWPQHIRVRIREDQVTGSEDSYTISHDKLLSVSASDGVLANDSAVSGFAGGLQPGLGVEQIAGGGLPNLNLFTDGSFDYVPEPGFTGRVEFKYKPVDTYASGRETKVSITVQDTPPKASPDVYKTTTDAPLYVTAASGVLANDSDLDGDSLSAQLIESPMHGTLTLTAGGGFAYVPSPGFVGTDRFLYRVKTSYSYFDGTYTTIVPGVGNIVPVAIVVGNATATGSDETYSTNRDSALNVPTLAGVLANDADPDGDAFSVTVVQNVQHGTLQLHPRGGFTYVPDQGFAGTELFTYQVVDPFGVIRVSTVRIQVATTLPTAQADRLDAIPDEGRLLVPMTEGVLTNDSDASGNLLSAYKDVDAAHGAVAISLGGHIRYTPDAGYVGTDLFVYHATNLLFDSKPAAVSWEVTHPSPTARDDGYVTAANQALAVSPWNGVLANDSLQTVQPVAVQLVAGPQHGVLTLNAGGSFLYRPDAGYVGDDLFFYRLSDGASVSRIAAVTIQVVHAGPSLDSTTYSAQHDAPLVVPAADGLLGDAQSVDGSPLRVELVDGARHGVLSVQANGSFVYRPTAGFAGNDTFLYRVGDGISWSKIAVARIDVADVPPTAQPERFRITHDSVLSQPSWQGLLANDSDSEGSELEAVAGRSPVHGTLTLASSGAFTYVPAAGFTGIDSFTYRAFDGKVFSKETLVTIYVENDAPIAKEDAFAAHPNNALTISAGAGVLANDSDPDGDLLQARLVSTVSHGRLFFGASGSFSYVPELGFIGIDQFTYATGDGFTETSPTIVRIHVSPESEPGPIHRPTAIDDVVAIGGMYGSGSFSASTLLANDSNPDDKQLSVAIVGNPSHGTLSFSYGSWYYTPDASWQGTDSATYQISDGVWTSTGKVRFVSAPTVQAADDVFEYSGTGTLYVSAYDSGVLRNDLRMGGTASLLSQAAFGTVVLQSDGSFTYTPTSAFSGQDSFRYRLTDGSNTSDATVIVRWADSLPEIPQTQLAYQGQQDQLLLVTAPQGVLAGLTDSEGDTLSARVVVKPLHGLLQLQPDGSFSYLPDPGFVTRRYQGDDAAIEQFTVEITDGLKSKQRTIRLHVLPPAVSLDDGYVGIAATALSVSAGDGLLRNDAIAAGDVVAAVLVQAPSHGQVTLRNDGSFDYVPSQGFVGEDSFTYRLSEAFNDSAEATVRIRIGSAAVAAADDAFTVVHDRTLTSHASRNLLANDSLASGGFSAILVSGPSHGVLTLNADGTFSYVPDAQYVGADSFVYRAENGSDGTNDAVVRLQVTNVAPVAVDDSYSLQVNGSLTAQGILSPLENDRDPDGDSLTWQVLTNPNHGTLSWNNGQFVYTPDADFVGLDSFAYQASDGIETRTAHVRIQVADRLSAKDDRYFTWKDQTVTQTAEGGVLANDHSQLGLPLGAELVDGPQHGSLSLGADGSFMYRPNAGFVGSDSFSYRATDGSNAPKIARAAIEVLDVVQAKNDQYSTRAGQILDVDATQGLLANDFFASSASPAVQIVQSPRHGTLSIGDDGAFRFTPAAGYSGSDQFAYRLQTASGWSNTALVSLTIADTAPVGVADTYETTHDVALPVLTNAGVLANDTDAETQALIATLISGPSHGTLVLKPSGAFYYEPAPGYVGTDTFVYKADDGFLKSNAVTVTIQVKNAAPKATADVYTVTHSRPFAAPIGGSVLGNDSDADGDRLFLTVSGQPSHGTLDLRPNGQFVYVPDAGFVGDDSFSYQVADGFGGTDTGSVTLHVVNAKPTSGTDQYSVRHDDVLAVLAAQGVLANETDSDGDVLTAELVSDPSHGTLTFLSTGAFLYTPDQGYYGDDFFVYRPLDGTAGGNSFTVRISVTDSAPYAVMDEYQVPLNTALYAFNNEGAQSFLPTDGIFAPLGSSNGMFDTNALDNANGSLRLVVTPGRGSVLANDTDGDGDFLTASVTVAPQHGSVTMSPDGAFVYVPNPNFQGYDTFQYQVTDGARTATGTARLKVGNPEAGNNLPALTYRVMPGALLAVSNVSEGVLQEDRDVSGSFLSAVVAEGMGTTHGTLTLKPNGTFLYEPNAGYVGLDQFSFNILQDGVPLYAAPIAVVLQMADDRPASPTLTFATAVGTNLTATAATGLLSLAIDPNPGQTLGVYSAYLPGQYTSFPYQDGALVYQGSDPQNPQLTIQPNGSFTFRPTTGFTGTFEFRIRIWDNINGLIYAPREGNGIRVGNGYSEEITVRIVVTNDVGQRADIQGDLEYAQAKAAIDRNMMAAGRSSTRAMLIAQFDAKAAFATAYRQQVEAYDASLWGGVANPRQNLIDAQTELADHLKSAADAQDAARRDRIVAAWTTKSDQEEASSNDRLADQDAYRNATLDSLGTYLDSLSAADAAYWDGYLALDQSQHAARNASARALVEAEANATNARRLAASQASQTLTASVLSAEDTYRGVVHGLQTQERATIELQRQTAETAIFVDHQAFAASSNAALQIRNAGVATAKSAYEQAVAAALAQVTHSASSATWDVGSDATFLAAVGSAQAAYDAQVASLDAAYRSTQTLAVASYASALTTANQIYDLSLKTPADALKLSVANATNTWIQSVIDAQADQSSADTAANNAYVAARQSIGDVFAVSVQSASLTYETADLTAQNAYRFQTLFARATRDAALDVADTTYETVRSLSDNTLRNDQIEHQTNFDVQVAAAVAAMDLAEQDRQAALTSQSATAAGLVVADYLTAWLTASIASEGADRALDDARRSISAAFNQAFVSANADYHRIGVACGASYDDEFETSTGGVLLAASLNQAATARLDAYYVAIKQYLSGVSLNQGEFTLKKTLKADFLQADLAFESTSRNASNEFHDRESARSQSRGRAIAEAQRSLIVSQADADATYAESIAQAGKTFQIAIVGAQAQSRDELVGQAESYAISFGQNVKQWTEDLVSAAATRDADDADSFRTWRQMDNAALTVYRTQRIDAECTLAENVALAQRVYATGDSALRRIWNLAANQAGHAADVAMAQADHDVFVAYVQAENAYGNAVVAAGQVSDALLRVPIENWRIQVIQAEHIWNDAAENAAADLAQAIGDAQADHAGSNSTALEQAIATARSASAEAFVQANVPPSQWNDASLREVAQFHIAQAWQARVADASAAHASFRDASIGGAHGWLSQANTSLWVAAIQANLEDKNRQFGELTPQAVYDAAVAQALDQFETGRLDDDLAWSDAVADAVLDERVSLAALDLAFADDFAALDQQHADAIASAEWIQDQSDLAAERILLVAEAIRASVGEATALEADWNTAIAGIGSDHLQADALADAEKAWLTRVWTDWSQRQDNQTTLEELAAPQLFEAVRQATVALTQADKTFAHALESASYTMMDQAAASADASEKASRTKADVRALQRIAQLTRELADLLAITNPADPAIQHIGPHNPYGTPPQQRPAPTGDILKDLLADLAYLQRIGRGVRAGDVAVYEDLNGNLQSGVQAVQQGLTLAKMILDVSAKLIGALGGPAGLAFQRGYDLAFLIKATIEGDADAARSALTSLLVRMPGGALTQLAMRGYGFYLAANNLADHYAEYARPGSDRAAASLQMLMAAIDVYQGAAGLVHSGLALSAQARAAAGSVATRIRGLFNRTEAQRAQGRVVGDTRNPRGGFGAGSAMPESPPLANGYASPRNVAIGKGVPGRGSVAGNGAGAWSRAANSSSLEIRTSNSSRAGRTSTSSNRPAEDKKRIVTPNKAQSVHPSVPPGKKGPYRGGPHSETTKPKNDGYESHHMPAKSVSGIADPKSKGPAIKMDPNDHAETSSNGKKAGSDQYRERIGDLINANRFRDAMAVEIRDVRRAAQVVSGNRRKYNEAIGEMLDYSKTSGILPPPPRIQRIR